MATPTQPQPQGYRLQPLPTVAEMEAPQDATTQRSSSAPRRRWVVPVVAASVLVLGLAVREATTRVTSLPLAVITAVIGAAAAAALVLVVIHLADRSLLASVRGGRSTVTTKDDKEQP